MSIFDTLPEHLTQLPPEAQAALLAEAEAMLAEVRSDPLNHGLPPHAVQELVHASTHRFRLVVAANRLGKSHGGMREVLWSARGEHPYKVVRQMNTVWVCCPDYPFYQRVTKKKFEELCPPSWVVKYHETEKWVQIRRADGGICTIYFLSYDMGRAKFQGASVDLIWLDEELPQDVFEECMARLVDSRGYMLMTLTPVSGMGWIYHVLYKPALDGEKDIEVIEGSLAEYRPECVCGALPEEHDKEKRCARTGCEGFQNAYEACVGRPLVPHLSREDILFFARQIADEDQRLIRIFGMFRANTGGVYRMFRRDVHLIPRFRIPAHWEVWGGCDPGRSWAFCLYAMGPEGVPVVVSEHFSEDEVTSKRAADAWAKVRAALDYGYEAHERRLAEPLVVYVDTADPQEVLELNHWSHEAGVPLVFASLDQGLKARMAGILRVQEYLTPDAGRRRPAWAVRETGAHGEPRLYLVDDLESEWTVANGDDVTRSTGSRLAWEIEGYRWKQARKGGGPTPQDADEKSAGGAHMLAAFRYALMARMGPPEAPEEDRRAGLSERERRAWEHLDELEAQLLSAERDDALW